MKYSEIQLPISHEFDCSYYAGLVMERMYANKPLQSVSDLNYYFCYLEPVEVTLNFLCSTIFDYSSIHENKFRRQVLDEVRDVSLPPLFTHKDLQYFFPHSWKLIEHYMTTELGVEPKFSPPVANLVSSAFFEFAAFLRIIAIFYKCDIYAGANNWDIMERDITGDRDSTPYVIEISKWTDKLFSEGKIYQVFSAGTINDLFNVVFRTFRKDYISESSQLFSTKYLYLWHMYYELAEFTNYDSKRLYYKSFSAVHLKNPLPYLNYYTNFSSENIRSKSMNDIYKELHFSALILALCNPDYYHRADFITNCCRVRPEAVFYADLSLLNDDGFIIDCLKANPSVFEYLPNFILTEERILNMFRHDISFFKYLIKKGIELNNIIVKLEHFTSDISNNVVRYRSDIPAQLNGAEAEDDAGLPF